MTPYRTPSPPLPCSHVWRQRTVHFNYGASEIVVECRRCFVRSQWREICRAALLGTAMAALLMTFAAVLALPILLFITWPGISLFAAVVSAIAYLLRSTLDLVRMFRRRSP